MSNPLGIQQVFTDDELAGVAFKNKSLKRQIIRWIDTQGNSTITDISQHIANSVPKTTSLVNELVADGLLCEYGKEDSTGGRKASLFGLVAESGYFLGVDVRRYYINIGLLDFKRSVVKLKEKVPFELANTAASYQDLIKVILDFISVLEVEKQLILAAGINLSGRVNRSTGHSYSYFHFNEEPLSKGLSRETGIPVFLENDSRAMAFGEFFGTGTLQASNALFLNLDYGTGMGIMIDGKMYYGKSGFSGEIGHVPMFDNEIICSCGKKGCLETEASGWALLRNFRQRVQVGVSTILHTGGGEAPGLEDILDGARRDDTLCIELLAEMGEKIGRGIAFLVNVFNPELVVIGGLLSQAGDYLKLPMRSTVNKLTLSMVNNDTRIQISKLGETAGVIGGALLARDRLLNAHAL